MEVFPFALGGERTEPLGQIADVHRSPHRRIRRIRDQTSGEASFQLR